jgi:hypothetical protein
MDLMMHDHNRLRGPMYLVYKTSRCWPALALCTNATPTLPLPILLYHLVPHPSFRVVLNSRTSRLHLPGILDRVPTLVTVRPPLDEVLRSGIALLFMKNIARLRAFLAHLPAFTPGPLQCQPPLLHIRPPTLCLLSHSSRLNLQHLMAIQNPLRTRPCRRLRRKRGLHPRQGPLILRKCPFQLVGVKLFIPCHGADMPVGTIPKGSSFLSSPPFTTATSNRSPELKRPSPLGTKPGFVKKILESLNTSSSIGLFNVNRRQSLKHASREKSPRGSEPAHSVVTEEGSEKASSRGSDHRSGGSGSGKNSNHRGSGSTSNGRADTGHSPTDEKVYFVAFCSFLYLFLFPAPQDWRALVSARSPGRTLYLDSLPRRALPHTPPTVLD